MENWGGFNTTPSNESSFIVPWQGFEGVAEDKALSVAKSHSQAEKRRRDRINAQLSALRKLIPKSDKMDKAALLGSAIEQVKDLKRKAGEISKAFSLPTEVDEVSVDYCEGSKDKMLIKASVCCDDRPEVFAELIRVFKGLRLSTVEADISSVGGRMRSSLILCNDDNSSNSEETTVCLSTLKQSLNVVLSRIASSSAGSSCRIRSKRQRLFFPSHFT